MDKGKVEAAKAMIDYEVTLWVVISGGHLWAQPLSTSHPILTDSLLAFDISCKFMYQFCDMSLFNYAVTMY